MGSAISAERLDLRRGDRVAVWRCEPGNWQPRHRKAIRVVLCLVALASQTQRGVLGSARTSFGECLPPLQCMVLLLLLLTGLSLIDRSDDGSGASSGASAGLQRRCWPRQSLHGLQGRRRRGGAALRSVRCWRGLGRGWTGGLPGDGEACLAPWRLRRGEPPPGPDGEDRRAASWHWAYRTAEESAGVITVRDICGDFDGFPRVWAIHRCPPPFLGKQEAVFRRDGTYSDTALFRGVKGSFTVLDSVGGTPGLVGIQLFFRARPVAGTFVAQRCAVDWRLELRAYGREGSFFVSLDRPADDVWEASVASMPQLLR
mmetsp:Transcript_29891/g.94218  ORF Transcript_29891/g.94218 Transcript_29891/m.94218 type:complete len:315 (-) Transcript_29891:85-1029(-)